MNLALQKHANSILKQRFWLNYRRFLEGRPQKRDKPRSVPELSQRSLFWVYIGMFRCIQTKHSAEVKHKFPKEFCAAKVWFGEWRKSNSTFRYCAVNGPTTVQRAKPRYMITCMLLEMAIAVNSYSELFWHMLTIYFYTFLCGFMIFEYKHAITCLYINIKICGKCIYIYIYVYMFLTHITFDITF